MKYYESDDFRKANSETMLSLWADPVWRAQALAAREGSYSTPAFRAKRARIMERRWGDPEYVEQYSKMMEEKWRDPEYRERNLAAREITPEYREAAGERAKGRWADPAYKLRVVAAIGESRAERVGREELLGQQMRDVIEDVAGVEAARKYAPAQPGNVTQGFYSEKVR
jgi:hypothetical protein